MKISSVRCADVMVTAVDGRIDHQSAGQFEAALAEPRDPPPAIPRSIVLDFAGVDYISSVGLRVLMVASQRARKQGTRIAVAGPRPMVAEIFAISRFDRVLELFPSVTDALAQFSASALAAFEPPSRASAE